MAYKIIRESHRESKNKALKDKYWRNVKEYSFKMNTGEKLTLYALTEERAKKSAKEHEKWLHKKGFKKDKVLLNTIEEVKY
jgi:hypothetical protein